MTEPLSADEFSHLMAACGPFEARPKLAVAVSGGADSMALMHLVHVWAQDRGGQVCTLTVDHDLRPEAGAEAAQVRRWCEAAGIEHHVLRWEGPKPRARLQERARRARYDLMAGWCRRHGLLHLLVAHHQGDQAETFLMRRERGSGPEGLAAMPPVALPPGAGYRWPRLLRPLLPVPKCRLEATLVARQQSWIDDPSNENAAYQRVRLRKRIVASGDPDAFRAELAAQADAYRKARDRVETELGRLLADRLSLSPYGYALIGNHQSIAADLAIPLWSRMLRTIGGRAYPPRGDRVGRFVADLGEGGFRGATLAGCVVQPRGDALLVAREPAGIEGERRLDRELVWDNRFLIRNGTGGPFTVRKLGEDGVRTLNRRWPLGKGRGVLPLALRSLPGLFRGGELVGLPHFAGASPTAVATHGVEAAFVPTVPLLW
ncbi:MAG: tRNA lysidine(34) synthetase TilS [Alphaproteobacteria bacterium]|nr:MAG: tRNA lysidine(34) synthetase TilS [Alphaproteobacteria bacterium]